MRPTGAFRMLGLLAMAAGLAGPAHAYFFDYGPGVRPAGMGRAFTAVADDVNALNWNPAGLSYLPGYEATAMYASLFMGLQARLYDGTTDRLGYGFVAAAYPLPPEIGTLGASWTQFGSHFYRENTFQAGWGRNFIVAGETLQAGANLKVLNWIQDANDYTEGIQKTAFTVDTGLKYAILENLHIGAMLENWIPANVGHTIYEEAPRTFRLGLSWKYVFPRADGQILDSLLLAGDWGNRSYADNKNTVAFGVEGWMFQRMLAFRTGVNSTEVTVGFSGCLPIEALNRTIFELDYSFAFPFYIQKTYGTHRLALTIREKDAPYQKAKLQPETKEMVSMIQASASPALQPPSSPANVSEVGSLSSPLEELRKELGEAEKSMVSRKLKPILFKKDQIVIENDSVPTLVYLGNIFQKYPHGKVKIVLPDEHTALANARKTWLTDYWTKNFKISRVFFVNDPLHPLLQGSNAMQTENCYEIKVQEETSNYMDEPATSVSKP